jgi:hypothetical protein
VFTRLKKIDDDKKRYCCFDEFDAALNPSLIESLFVLLEKVSCAVIVVMNDDTFSKHDLTLVGYI